ncbi:MAG: hypothetical protein RIK87_15250 [Fuerstiella sp.]
MNVPFLAPLLNSLSCCPGRRNARRHLNRAADVLEDRRLLSGTGSDPQISATSVDAMLMVVVDAAQDGGLQLHIDIDDDGTVDFEYSVASGETTFVDLSMHITPNTTVDVGITAYETVYSMDPVTAIPGIQTLSSSLVLPVDGVTVTATPFTWLNGAYGTVFGAVDTEGVNGSVYLRYREVGQTFWTEAGIISGEFTLYLDEADGQKDFEFQTATRYNSVEVLSGITTLYDIEPYNGGSSSSVAGADSETPAAEPADGEMYADAAWSGAAESVSAEAASVFDDSDPNDLFWQNYLLDALVA